MVDKEVIQAGIDALTMAIGSAPTATLYKERGRLRMLAGDDAGAMDDIRKAAELDPTLLDQVSGQFNVK